MTYLLATKLKIKEKLKNFSYKNEQINHLNQIKFDLEHNLSWHDIMIKYNISDSSLELYMRNTFNFKYSSVISDPSNVERYIVLHKVKILKIKNVGKKLIYPVFLWLVSVLFSLFYCLYFSKTLISFLTDFKIEPTIIYKYKILSYFVIMVFFFAVLIVIVGILISTSPDLKIAFLLKYQNRNLGKYCNQLISYQFIKLIHIYQTSTLSIQDILLDIMDISKNSINFWVASTIHNDLLNGKSLEQSIGDSYLNPTVQTVFLLTQFDINNGESENYLEILSEDIRHSESRIIRFTKLISYVSIFISVVVFYLSLLVPLKIMEGF